MGGGELIFRTRKNKTEHMNLKLFLAGDRFGLLVDLRSVADRTMHGPRPAAELTQANYLADVLAHIEVCDRAVREDVQGLRLESEGYAQM